MDNIMTITFDDFKVTYKDNPDIHKLVFNKVMEYFIMHQSFSGEVIVQDDNCNIDASSVMASIADNIIKFKVENV